MRKIIIPNKLHHKPQAMQGCVKKIKRIRRKNDCSCLLKYFAVKGLTLEGCRRTLKIKIQSIIITRIIFNVAKDIGTVLIIYLLDKFCYSHGNECQKSWVGWFL